MVRARTIGFGLLLLVAPGRPILAEDPLPQKYELTLVAISEGAEPEYILVVGQSGFKSVESLKRFLALVEPGSELVWNPGCLRSGKEPVLSSEQELKEFRAFLEEHGIKFTLVRAG